MRITDRFRLLFANATHLAAGGSDVARSVVGVCKREYTSSAVPLPKGRGESVIRDLRQVY